MHTVFTNVKLCSRQIGHLPKQLLQKKKTFNSPYSNDDHVHYNAKSAFLYESNATPVAPCIIQNPVTVLSRRCSTQLRSWQDPASHTLSEKVAPFRVWPRDLHGPSGLLVTSLSIASHCWVVFFLLCCKHVSIWSATQAVANLERHTCLSGSDKVGKAKPKRNVSTLFFYLCIYKKCKGFFLGHKKKNSLHV